MQTHPRSLAPGITLVALGILFLIPRLFHVHLADLWPLLMIGGGVAFFFGFIADRSNYGLLMPGTILTVIGLLIFYCTVEGWYMMETLWPFFIIAPGLGFVLMYLFGRKERGLLIPAGILLAVGSFFLLARSEYDYLWPLVLIAFGVFLLVAPRQKGQSS